MFQFFGLMEIKRARPLINLPALQSLLDAEVSVKGGS